MSKPIYVMTPDSKPLQLSSGPAVAFRPLDRGDKHSFALLESGRMARVSGARINGIGIERFIVEQGYIKAQPGHLQGDCLARKISVEEGVKLVDRASLEQAAKLQALFGGKECTYVPFAPDKPAEKVLIASPDGIRSCCIDFSSGMSCGNVKVSYARQEGYRSSDIHLSDGWLVGPNGDPSAMPRGTDYGGLIERAAFIIANAGLGSIVRNLTCSDHPATEDPFPRGRMELALTDSEDRVVIGIDAGDELVVQYVDKNNDIVCTHTGLDDSSDGRLRICDAVGAIAAVIVVAEAKKELAAKEKPAVRRKKP